MRNEVFKNIIISIKSSHFEKIDLYLQSFFDEILKEYDFRFVHNKVFSRKLDKAYEADCKIIHVLTIGFNYYLKSTLPKSSKALPEHLNDSTNSILLQHVSNPALVNDLLKYLHCYLFGLALPSNDRCMNAREFLKFEHMLKRYDEVVEKSKAKLMFTSL